MIIIYAPKAGSRTTYVIKQVFEGFLGVPYRLTNREPETLAGTFVVAYTARQVPCDLHIVPCGLLEEQGIAFAEPAVEKNGEEVKLFPNASQHLGFDVFAAVFWMLSRYEEYRPFTPDRHGRFPASASLAGRQQFVQYPVVDQWMKKLAGLVEQKLPGFVPSRPFNMINTIDVDNAYAYRGKGFFRQTGALLKHLLKGETALFKERIRVLRGKTHDPYDQYAFIRSLAQARGVPTIFFHLSSKLGPHDRNISVNGKTYRTLLAGLRTWSTQGLHPSYRSSVQEPLFAEEKKMLETAADITVNHSRQHFLRMHFPGTYRALVQAGIRYDFTMGFADQAGFRAGTGRAFTFYDLAAEAETTLVIQPFCLMEGTLRDYMHLDTTQAMQLVQEMKKRLGELGSTYVAVWHNETLCDRGPWKGWRAVYESQFS